MSVLRIALVAASLLAMIALPGLARSAPIYRYLQERAANRENIAFVLQTGDLIQAVNGHNNNTPLNPGCMLPPVNGCAGYAELMGSIPGVPPGNPGNPIDPSTGNTACGCWEHFNLTKEWDKHRERWSPLDGVLPYALVAGNHLRSAKPGGGGRGVLSPAPRRRFAGYSRSCATAGWSVRS
jgi:hypothetical protein